MPQQGKVTVQVKPVEPVIEAGAQVQQLVNSECIDDFDGKFIFYFELWLWILFYSSVQSLNGRTPEKIQYLERFENITGKGLCCGKDISSSRRRRYLRKYK